MTDSPFGSPFDGGATRSTRARMLTIAALLVGAALGAWYFTRGLDAPPMDEGHGHSAGAAAPSSTPVMLDSASARRIGVTFAPVERGVLVRRVRSVGRVVVDETRQSVISPKVDGWVDELFVNTTGATVQEGTPLFALYSPMLVAAQEELVLAARLATDAAARGDTAGTAADLLKSARRRLEYWDVPATEIDRVIRSGVAARTLVLRAPRDGVVLVKAVVSGQRIMAGDVAFSIAALDRVWIEGEVFEQDLAAARVGSAVEVETDAFPGQIRRGRIAFVAPVVRADTRTVQVRVEVKNGDARLKPGMLATLHLIAGAGVAVLHIPRSAVLVTGTRTIVFVRMADGMLEPREVRLGRATDERQEVISGLARGEVVVQSATFLIDAESNLRSALGAMGAMPGMPEMDAPAKTPVKSPELPRDR